MKRRESQSKSQTQSTRKIEEAIDQVETSMAETRRIEELKEKESQLAYSTKPSLKEFLKKERESRHGEPTTTTQRQRTRSLSSSGRLEQSWTINSKYAKAKPKVATRPPTARATNVDNQMRATTTTGGASSHRDMNDSTLIRFYSLDCFNYSQIF